MLMPHFITRLYTDWTSFFYIMISCFIFTPELKILHGYFVQQNAVLAMGALGIF